ncbi:chymotrypsin-1-like [Manduca sexta]|uniref:chymotrypsin-1-like n=1 Tax=Manduca sexta TaxID=7130 RepID=UPI0018903A68|nr:chymotrypsin-1-like [Manduca sexta]
MTPFAVILLLVGFTCANSVYENTAYGYLQRYGVPAAERIRKAEENVATSRIVGGSLAPTGQFKYQAGLLISMVGSNGTGVCGASLLSANRLVTAAHCWYDGVNQARLYVVVLGTVTLFSGGTRIATGNVTTHPNWIPRYLRNDIAVIYLPRKVTFSSNIGPVALPSGSELREDFMGSIAMASGFGMTSDGSMIRLNQSLSYVNLTVISNELCSVYYPILVQSSNICTGSYRGSGACHGDSGGPLVTISNKRPVLIGVVSFGSVLGCEINFPSAYTRVSSFISFINQHL